MKISDKIRRAIFKVSAEGASLFEWAIWSTILTFLIGLPIVISVLQSLGKGLIVAFVTGVILFVLTTVLLGITDGLLKVCPFVISEEELEYESSYQPRIPYDNE